MSPSIQSIFAHHRDRGAYRVQNYTQNIDTLETLAGVQRVVQCHGSFATASCINCRVRVPGSEIADDIMNQEVPVCKACNVPQPPVATKAGKKKAKKRKDGWDSDASDEPEPPLYPPGIMKVNQLSTGAAAIVRISCHGNEG